MDKMHNILLVDDDRSLGELVRDYLKNFNFQVEIVTRPSYALKKINTQIFEAAIVDVMMPEMDGFELVRRLRATAVSLPIIMLTARGELADRVFGLEIGADDYLPKPFEPRELAARLTGLIRRSNTTLISPEQLGFDGLRLQVAAQEAQLLAPSGEWTNAHLTTSEFRALAALVAVRPRVVSRDDLSAQLRGLSFDYADRSLDIMISRLRAKLRDNASEPRYIKTVRHVGYAFIATEHFL